MSSLTINIKEEHVEALRQKAAQSRISMEQLIEKYIQQMLESNERDTLMEQATEYVLNKNYATPKTLQTSRQQGNDLYGTHLPACHPGRFMDHPESTF